jgi:hypothetical protein
MDRVKIQMDLSSSGQGPVASSCEHGSDLWGNFLTRLMAASVNHSCASFNVVQTSLCHSDKCSVN